MVYTIKPPARTAVLGPAVLVAHKQITQNIKKTLVVGYLSKSTCYGLT
jgi:hypothetical protein